MCGIAGILTAGEEVELGPVLTRMRFALQHRGPDDEGCEQISLPCGYQLGLANTRLAILDVTQPATSRCATPTRDPGSSTTARSTTTSPFGGR